MHSENVAPILDGLVALSISDQVELSLQMQPFSLDVEGVQESELIMDHCFRVVCPHVVDAVGWELRFVCVHVGVHGVHVRKQNTTVLDVALYQWNDCVMIFIFQKISHTYFGLAAVHSKNPSDAGKSCKHVKPCGPDEGFINFHYTWEFDIGLDKLRKIMATSPPEQGIVVLNRMLAQPLGNETLCALNKQQ